MENIGNFALLGALIISVYTAAAALLSARTNSFPLYRSAQRGIMITFGLYTTALLSLEYLLISGNFHVAAVASTTNIHLPLFYKISALWAGHDGSLLLWAWMLALFSFVAMVQYRNKHRAIMPYVIAVLAGTTVFFAFMNYFIANPFQVLTAVTSDGQVFPYAPEDGQGMNPLLQHPAMVIHPPILYIGFVSFVVPFAFAMAALFAGKLGDTWIKTIRRWCIFSWFFLGTGVLLGARWAYVELGWGGYWGWDPVENASLLPWLTGTAYLHSVMIQEKRGMLKIWNLSLVIGTYLLCVFGTFLTRSGIVSSVHAFAQSSLGPLFIGYIVLTGILAAYFIIKHLPILRSENHLDSLVSRESSFLFNNLILLCACFAILWGTLFPVISEAVQGVKISVGAPFFNMINIPIFLFLLFLTGVGPLFAWRRTSVKSLRKNFVWPTILTIGGALLLLATGIRHVYAFVSFTLSIFVIVTILQEFVRGARTRSKNSGEQFFAAMVNMSRRNKRRYGGYIIHFGMVLIFIGATGQAFNKERQQEMIEGDIMTLGPYSLSVEKITSADNPNYASSKADIVIFKGGKYYTSLSPEKRFYKVSEQTTTEVAIHSTLIEDLYLVFAGINPDTKKAIIKAHVNPLVKWVWIGGFWIFFGTIVVMVPDKRGKKWGRILREQLRQFEPYAHS